MMYVVWLKRCKKWEKGGRRKLNQADNERNGVEN